MSEVDLAVRHHDGGATPDRCTKPLALTLGDPAGVGPEIVAKAWAALKGTGPAFTVIGDAAVLVAQGAPVHGVSTMSEGAARFADALPVLDRPVRAPVSAGQASADHAPAIVAWIESAVELCLAGEAAGVVTAPIAKAPLYEAGFKFPGHTEFLAELTRGKPIPSPLGLTRRGPVMMLASGDLRTVLVTIHEPYAKVPSLLTVERIVHTAAVTAEALKSDFGIARPRLAVAGLNPHAGESGQIGREEIEVIIPAVTQLRALGIDAVGPKPADTLFHAEARRTYDTAVCMYHDQALIPVKMLDFWSGVNITLGLPIVRTSPDHGTGFDVAGKGVARPDSLIAAIRIAHEIASRRRRA
ncbi:4-hydroxythreonine-4-phosphate dehydrogenase PdxA [Bradyrhizobium sp.]|uniref:4-hydroxythreonine-4-phosphate dehydrogenase PdxA n=1 Tax=Bradyrhizobium sp. TaxID=376 RepID=UPI0039E24621